MKETLGTANEQQTHVAYHLWHLWAPSIMCPVTQLEWIIPRAAWTCEDVGGCAITPLGFRLSVQTLNVALFLKAGSIMLARSCFLVKTYFCHHKNCSLFYKIEKYISIRLNIFQNKWFSWKYKKILITYFPSYFLNKWCKKSITVPYNFFLVRESIYLITNMKSLYSSI